VPHARSVCCRPCASHVSTTTRKTRPETPSGRRSAKPSRETGSWPAQCVGSTRQWPCQGAGSRARDPHQTWRRRNRCPQCVGSPRRVSGISTCCSKAYCHISLKTRGTRADRSTHAPRPRESQACFAAHSSRDLRSIAQRPELSYVRTEMYEEDLRQSPDWVRVNIASIPVGRIAEVRDVSAVVLWLMSEVASYVTGSIVDISGGRVTQ